MQKWKLPTEGTFDRLRRKLMHFSN